MEPLATSIASTTDLGNLNDRLEAIWIQYLDLLDTYTKAQAVIQHNLAAGFFSLAQANARAASGRRYGQDWYDGRMKATRRVQLLEDVESKVDNGIDARMQNLHISISKTQKLGPMMTKHTLGVRAEPPEQPEQQPLPPVTPGPEPEHYHTPEAPKELENDPVLKDPLRWFGILVPPELRRAQSTFSTIFEGETASKIGMADQHIDGKICTPELETSPVTEAAAAARQMRELEMEIRKIRKAARKLERKGVDAGT